MTKREQIIQGITSLISTNLNDVQVTRSRIDPFEDEDIGEKTVISIEPVGETCEETHVGINDWNLSIEITFYRKSEKLAKCMP